MDRHTPISIQRLAVLKVNIGETNIKANLEPHLGVAQTLEFVQSVAKPPASILEAGCGDGALARRLMELGFAVTAIDRSAEAVQSAQFKGVPAKQSDFLEYETDKCFDVLLFSRAFHHIHPIESAVKRSRRLLNDDGLLLLEEFAVELMDLNSALWFYGLMSIIESNEKPPERHGPKLENGEIPSNPLENWRQHHIGKHSVTDWATIFNSLQTCFGTQSVARVPYLYRYLVDSVAPAEAEHIFKWEKALCDSGRITPIGMRYVGRKLETPSV
jgi:SAM-dependent methyltransferase